MPTSPGGRSFSDETLRQLINEALANNYDLRIAVSRVEQARQIAAQARSQFFPQISYDGAVATGKNSFLGTASPNSGKTEGSALLDLSVFWEIDIWGRIRRLNEAALAQFLATEEARRGVMISLVSSVAQAYFELLQLDLALDITKRSTQSFEDTLTLFTQRLEGGAASKLETATAEAYLGAVAANVPELERQIVLKENQINVLLGRNPGPVERHAGLLEESLPPEVPPGLPSALLERRPDIRLAEQNLRTANARVGVAMADFFPSIGLTSLFGQVSPELSAFTSGSANLWAVAGNMTGPVFRGGLLVARYRQEKAAWEEAKLVYEQTALNAFQEVSNALISRQKYAEVRAQQARAVRAYQEAVQVSLQALRGRKNQLLRSAPEPAAALSGRDHAGPDRTQSAQCHRPALQGPGRRLARIRNFPAGPVDEQPFAQVVMILYPLKAPAERKTDECLQNR